MNCFTVKTSTALRRAIAQGSSLALYATEGEISLRLLDASRLRLTRFDTGETAPFELLRSGTDKDEYLAGVNTVIGMLAERGGKVVISRVTVAESRRDVVDVIDDYFTGMSDMFRYVYTSAETGVWFGATPELFAAVDAEHLTLKTMSLAGTRRRSVSGRWDKKNREEHDLVTRFITDTLADGCRSIHVSPERQVKFGSIVHLCNDITALLSSEADVQAILSRLHPTPAVAGYPRRAAMDVIKAVERHARLYYAGTVTPVISGGPQRTYVNLRCAMARPTDSGTYRYNLFSGGGITADSDAEQEWAEAEAKVAPLLECIKQPCNKEQSIENVYI